MDLKTLVTNASRDGYFSTIARATAAQFGPPSRQYLGASLLPERQVPENAYREESIRYRTIIANDGTRYSATQKKKGELTGSFLVELGNSDIKREITAREYDALVALLGRNSGMDAVRSLINWSDVVLNRALLEKNEKMRWEAIVSASVSRQGDNGYVETVSYSNPSGHRFNATGTWSSNSFDPFTDISTAADLLASKGYTVNRIIAPRPVVTILSNNQKVQARVGLPVVNVGGTIAVSQARADVAAINGALQRDGLPAIEEYNLQYRTSTGSGYFLARNVFVLVATTGQDQALDFGDQERLLENTLGYTAIGRAAGQPAPGRVIQVESFSNKPPRIEGEAWQTSLPVVLEPEAIAVIGAIA